MAQSARLQRKPVKISQERPQSLPPCYASAADEALLRLEPAGSTTCSRPWFQFGGAAVQLEPIQAFLVISRRKTRTKAREKADTDGHSNQQEGAQEERKKGRQQKRQAIQRLKPSEFHPWGTLPWALAPYKVGTVAISSAGDVDAKYERPTFTPKWNI